MNIHKESQKGLILGYMQKVPNKPVSSADFVNPSVFSSFPYVGYSANTRMCDLKRAGLVTVYSKKIKGIKKFYYKARDRNLYTLTPKGLTYKLS